MVSFRGSSLNFPHVGHQVVLAPIPIYLLWKFIWAPLNRSFADAENQERAKAHPQMVDDS